MSLIGSLKRRPPLWAVILLILFIPGIYALLALQVSPKLTNDDTSAIQSLELDELCKGSVGDFQKEIPCLQVIQAKVQAFGEVRAADSRW